MAKVMLIDDDESMRLLIGQLVERQGYEFCCADNGVDGLDMLRRERPDLLILDVMLPDINGFELCQMIRGEGRRVPIMFLTAKGDIVDKSIGFKAGADDYLVKPFHNEEFVLRMNARLRKRGRASSQEPRSAASYRVGDLEIFFGKYDVRLRDKQVALSSREVELLEIMEHVWGDKDAADPSSITVFARKIREKIEDNPSKPRYLITVWRVGYKLADRL